MVAPILIPSCLFSKFGTLEILAHPLVTMKNEEIVSAFPSLPLSSPHPIVQLIIPLTLVV